VVITTTNAARCTATTGYSIVDKPMKVIKRPRRNSNSSSSNCNVVFVQCIMIC